MSIEQHTQGRLEVRGSVVYFAGKAGRFDIRNCPDPEANARRLGACWNACDGLPTELLEKHGVTRSGIAKGVQEIQAQRDTLLEALQEAREGLRWYQDRNPGQTDGSDDEAMARIDAAIANATGSAV